VLNAATSAVQIAAAIEIPGEIDIGIHIAKRIFDRRNQLGGFTSLQQVADVTLVGPKRFTDIVVSLSSERPPGRPPSALDLLQQEVDALRQSIAIGAGPAITQRRLTLRAVEPDSFLGQPLTVLATLLDGDVPAVDVPVTLVATRGELFASDGYQTTQGHLVSARTGLDGSIKLTLHAKTSEDITPIQQDALAAMLALLDPVAATPQQTAAGLRAMAQQYLWEVNLPFRQAVDIYVRDFRPHLLDTVNLREHLQAWSFQDSAVLAFAPAEGFGENGSSVAATATLHVRVKGLDPAFPGDFCGTRALREQTDGRAARPFQDDGRHR
jgi:hypothetical protein